MTYLNRNLGTKQTPQSEKIPGSTQIPNSAGGFTWKVDDWKRLDHFLILGSEDGSYYANERELTKDNISSVMRCIEVDGQRVVNQVIEISEAGRAPKNDQALFVLAACTASKDIKVRMSALEALPRVARIGTHLMHFISYAEQFRGWGKGLRHAVGDWYNNKPSDKLAFQVVKYQQRDKWSNADLLRLSHPKARTEDHNKIYKWVVDGELLDGVEDLIVGFAKAQATTDEKELIGLITKYKLTREMIPTQFHDKLDVWEAILPNLGLTAIIRNLGNMSKCGFLLDGKWTATNDVCNRITDAAELKRSRVHPFAILTALYTYQSGHGLRSKGEWPVSNAVIDALDKAFYLSFGNVTPTNKRLMLALDVSGSMEGSIVGGVPGLSARVASAAMAMVTFKTDQNTMITAFCNTMIPISQIGHLSRLSEVVKSITGLPFGGTDCSLPMGYALTNKLEIDAFIVYTDSETWSGQIHPTQMLNKYRSETGIPAKLIVVGMVSNGFSIADPNDSGMMDVVGFDTAAPEVMSNFIRE
jgi:60 kDa SS-A/Ro ribonucleoprotein